MDQEHYFELFSHVELVQRVYMNDGSYINLGNDAMLKAIEHLNEQSTEKLLTFLKPEIHDGSTRQQLEDMNWAPICDFGRREFEAKVKVLRLTEEEKKNNVATDEFKNDLIDLILNFCLFDKPPDVKPRGMSRTRYTCWKRAYEKSMDMNNDLRERYWSDVVMDESRGTRISRISSV